MQCEPFIAAPGLDCVVVCALDAAACLSRVTGARVDPLSGQVYNFTSSPPPSNKPGLALRLQAGAGLTAQSLDGGMCAGQSTHSDRTRRPPRSLRTLQPTPANS
jgi:hypothetical protein